MGQSDSREQACFGCMIDVESTNIEWKTFLRQECLDLEQQCVWAPVISKQLPKIRKTPQHRFYRQVKEVDVIHVESKMKSRSYSNSLLHEPLHSIQDKRTTHDLLKKIKRSELFEDDLLEAIHNIKGTNPRMTIFGQMSVTQSFQSFSSAPSFAFQETRCLKEQLREEPSATTLVLNQINYFLHVTAILEGHLQTNDHQLYQVLSLFQAAIIKNYGDPEPEQLVRFLFEIQQFSRVMEGCIELYYDFARIKNVQSAYAALFNDENLLNFVVTQLMDDKVIYGIFYKLLDAHTHQEIQIIKQNIKSLKGFTVEQCQIPLKFQLNEATYNYMTKKHETQIQYDDAFVPYDIPIKQLQKIRDKKSPCSKLKVIIKMSQQLMKSIKKFYKRYAFPFDGVIDADDLLPIQTYILLKSELFDIGIHIYMIEKLATNKLLRGTPGYYLTTLQASTEHLARLAQTNPVK